MISDNQKASDSTIQQLKSLGMMFSFLTLSDKLVINVQDQKEKQQYVAEIVVSPLVDFNDIKQLITQGQFKVLNKNQDLFKIKVGATPIELISKSRNEIKYLTETLTKSLQKQQEMQGIIDSQKDEIKQLKDSLSNLTIKVQLNSSTLMKQYSRMYELEIQLKKQQQLIKTIQESTISPQAKKLIALNKQKLFSNASIFGQGSIFGNNERIKQSPLGPPKNPFLPDIFVKKPGLFDVPPKRQCGLDLFKPI